MNFYQQKYFKPYHEMITSPQRNRQIHYRTPSTRKYRQNQKYHYSDRLTEQPVWQYLYNQGLKNQKQILQKHQATKHRIDIQCTFKPLIKQNKRYLLPSHSTFLQRNTVWMQNKIEKIVKQKQQQINKGLKECTFSPRINMKSKKVKADMYDYKIHKQSCPNQKMHNKSAIKIKRTVENRENEEPVSTPTKRNTYVQISRAKQMIRNELKRLVL